jgi:Putative DNA-binding domain
MPSCCSATCGLAICLTRIPQRHGPWNGIHHLFPKAFLASRQVTNTRQVNAIANMAFVDWPDNVSIGSDDPRAYWPVMTEKLGDDRIKRQACWHALPTGWEQLDYPTFLERRRQLIARVTRDGFSTLWGQKPPVQQASVADMVAAGESQILEFKSSARWNLRSASVDRKIEHVIVKTVCAFLNAEGGTLLIGVDDAGSAVGLSNDFKTLGAQRHQGRVRALPQAAHRQRPVNSHGRAAQNPLRDLPGVKRCASCPSQHQVDPYSLAQQRAAVTRLSSGCE